MENYGSTGHGERPNLMRENVSRHFVMGEVIVEALGMLLWKSRPEKYWRSSVPAVQAKAPC